MNERVNVDLASHDSYSGGAPLDWFAYLRNSRPISWQEDTKTGVGYWAITRREHIDLISKSPEIFSSAARTCFYMEQDDMTTSLMRSLLINMDPPEHLRFRRIVRSAFTPKAVDSYEPYFREIARGILDRVLPNGRCDFVSEIAADLPLIAICELMGIPQEDRHQFATWTNTMVGSDDPDLCISPDDAITAHFNVFSYGRKLAEMHRSNPKDNIVGALIDGLVDGEHLTDEEFCNFFMLLVIAGTETTRTVASQGMRLLIENPQEYRKLQQNIELVPHAIEEILRYNAPVILMRRTAMKDVEIDGVTLKEGDKILMFYQSANHDECVFKNPAGFRCRKGCPGEHIASAQDFWRRRTFLPGRAPGQARATGHLRRNRQANT